METVEKTIKVEHVMLLQVWEELVEEEGYVKGRSRHFII